MSKLEFRPELFVAYGRHGKYVVVVMHKGTPIGDGPRRYTRTSFVAYFHPRQPQKDELRCQVIPNDFGSARDAETLEEAIERCKTHARTYTLRPTAPGGKA
ncbi:MAG TPA: hypothetical protein VJN18_11125 [Polyangiaceae bacterium]|nr:hypothetical protein [Polyangiaceae bacterium]